MTVADLRDECVILTDEVLLPLTAGDHVCLCVYNSGLGLKSLLRSFSQRLLILFFLFFFNGLHLKKPRFVAPVPNSAVRNRLAECTQQFTARFVCMHVCRSAPWLCVCCLFV